MQLIDIIKDRRLEYINMKYCYGYSTTYLYVVCTIKEIGMNTIPISGWGQSETDALKDALNLLDRLKGLDVKIEPVEIANDYGNKQVVVKKDGGINYLVNFKKDNGLISINRLYKEDDAGLMIHDNKPPADMTIFKPYNLKEHGWYGYYLDKIILAEGERLFSWNTMYGLAGDCGLAVLDSENRILRSKLVAMS